MSAKKRKNFLWFKCDCCNSIVSQKDASAHKEKACPPNFQKWIHPFIINNCLFTSIDVFHPQGVVSCFTIKVDCKFLNQIIFVYFDLQKKVFN